MTKKFYARAVVFAAGLSFLFTTVNMFGQERVSGQEGASAAHNMPDGTAIIPGDILAIHVFDDIDLDQTHVRVTDNGEVTLLLIGTIKIGGMTAGEAAKVIADAYMSKHFLRNANILVSIDETSLASHAVTLFGYIGGAPNSPGANGVSIPLFAARPLMAVLSMAGGLSDRASHTITIERGDPKVKPFKVFLPNNPDMDLANQPMIYPGDTIVIPRAGIVYILGNVGQPHGVVMQEDGQITLMQALSQAGSSLPTAGLNKVMVFRKDGGTYQQIPVNMAKMVKGKTPDIQLVAEDVVWVPFSYGKNLLVNGASIIAALSSATASSVIYTHP